MLLTSMIGEKNPCEESLKINNLEKKCVDSFVLSNANSLKSLITVMIKTNANSYHNA